MTRAQSAGGKVRQPSLIEPATHSVPSRYPCPECEVTWGVTFYDCFMLCDDRYKLADAIQRGAHLVPPKEKGDDDDVETMHP